MNPGSHLAHIEKNGSERIEQAQGHEELLIATVSKFQCGVFSKNFMRRALSVSQAWKESFDDSISCGSIFQVQTY